LVAFSKREDFWGDVIRRVAERGFTMESFKKWLIGETMVFGRKGTNAFDLFVGILKRRKEMDEGLY